MVCWPDEVVVKRADLDAVIGRPGGLHWSVRKERLAEALNNGHALRCADFGHWWDHPVANEATCLRPACGMSRAYDHGALRYRYVHRAKEDA